jgi:adenylosuccinate synthase|tara:strand:+ start:1015 stop:1203 length:189 start_codon:yes stop_codon:yes gene_type:complete
MSTENNYLEKLITLLENTREDHEKFFSRSNNAAGTRVRKTMQEVKNLAQELRTHIQDTKNSQ